jgi:hypothetical protein
MPLPAMGLFGKKAKGRVAGCSVVRFQQPQNVIVGITMAEVSIANCTLYAGRLSQNVAISRVGSLRWILGGDHYG